VHAILDHSPVPFLEELAVEVHKLAGDLNRRVYLMPESAANDARLIRSRDCGGYGLDAVWSDDFHHALRTLLTGEQSGYYEDYGKFKHLVDAYRDGFAYSGQYSRFRKRRHGSPAKDIPAERFIVFSQNHDQVGNRPRGDRLTHDVCFEALKLAATTVILSPFIPLIFMGEEYGETAPFPYFISHSDAGLIEAVRRGRRAEFASFQWQGEIPDPQDEATFLQAKLHHEARHSERHRVLYEFYRELFRLRKTIPALANLNKDAMTVRGYDNEQVLFVHRWSEDGHAIIIESFGPAEASVSLSIPAGHWRKILDSTDKKWQGAGSSTPNDLHSEGAIILSLKPRSAVVFTGIE
jgi:maltooligosyltrehalose trehalohydrolase